MRKRLMIITHDLAIGGLQQVIVNLCRNINQNLFELSVLCLREKGEFAIELEKLGIDVILLPQTQKTDYFSFFKIAEILRKKKIEIIHTHNTQPFIEGGIAALFTGVKTFIHTDHAREFPDKKKYMFAEWLMSHFVDKIVGVSEHTSQNLMKYEKIAPKKIITIQNGIDEKIYQIKVEKNEILNKLNIKNRFPILGLGVRLTEQKGIKYLIDSMVPVKKHYPNIGLIIAGKGPLEPQLRQRVNEFGLDENVFFIGARLDMNEILKILDLYVLPSIWEGLPMVILEAMAAMCPIIATDVGGNSTAIKHNFNGSLVPPEDSAKLSDMILELLGDEVKRKQYTENSWKIFKEKFSAKVMTMQYEKLYLKQNL